MGEEGPRCLFGLAGQGASSPSWPTTSFLFTALLALLLLLALPQWLWLLVLVFYVRHVHL